MGTLPLHDEPETRIHTMWTKKFSFQEETDPKLTKVWGVELAPINTPWKRRMETLSMALWFLSFLMAGPVVLLLLTLALFTPFFFIPLGYLLWYFFDRETPIKGGRRLQWVRKLKVWRRYVDYFPIRLVKTADLDPSRNYLFCSHPHGIFCYGSFGCFATEAAGFSKKFPGLISHLLTLEINFRFPIYRDYIMAGGTCPASKESINYLLSHKGGGQVAIIVPGGAKESLDAHPGPECVLFLRQRKGFCKIALQNGSPLVPVFSFGETEVFDQVSNEPGSFVRSIQNWFQSIFGFAPVLIFGRGIFQYSYGVLPKRKPITVVVGTPLVFDKIEQPTREQVDDLHKQYIESLEALFEKYKRKYGTEDSYLKII